MDGRVPNSLPRLKNVSYCGTIVESIRDGRRIVSVPGSNPTCCKLGVDKRGRKNTEAGVLYQQGVERSGGTKSSFPHDIIVLFIYLFSTAIHDMIYLC